MNVKPSFRFACSYQGTVWFQVTDRTGTYKAELRHNLSDYERASLNGGADGAYAQEVERMIGWLCKSHCYKAAPISLETVEAFNAWRLAEFAASEAKYGPFDPADTLFRPPVLAVGAAHYGEAGWQFWPIAAREAA